MGLDRFGCSGKVHGNSALAPLEDRVSLRAWELGPARPVPLLVLNMPHGVVFVRPRETLLLHPSCEACLGRRVVRGAYRSVVARDNKRCWPVLPTNNRPCQI